MKPSHCLFSEVRKGVFSMEAMQKEMNRIHAYFPYRKISGVMLPDGSFEVFAGSTYAKANNYARKMGGVVYRFANLK